MQRPFAGRLSSGSQSGNAARTSAAGKQDLYQKLNEYEKRRRLAYASKFDSLSLYWKSYCDLFGAALNETSRAQRGVLGTSHAYLMYSEAMKAIYKDTFLDEKGNPILTNKKQQERLATSRKTFTGETKVSSSAKDAVSVVKEIREAQNTYSQRFEESAMNMDEEIAAAIGALLDTIQESFTNIERLGSSILVEMEKTEKEVAQAWGKYLDSKTPANKAGGNANSPKEEDVDPWVVEMQYRVAVAYQNLVWDKGSEELNGLLAKVKEEEVARRMNLREFLVAFAQRQQRLFLSLPGIQTQLLEDLVGKEMSREDIDKAVQKIIDDGAAKHKKKMTDAASEEDDFADFNLESPLSSDLLSKAKVVLRKGVGLDWTLSLLVMTADSYLHMFDIDSPKIKLNTPPEVAFTLLSPSLIAPSYDNHMLGNTNFGKGWSDPLTPTESLVLARCKVKRLDDTSFEVTESLATTGASKFMGKSNKRRMKLQTPTKEESDDWIQILTA
ncbi:MAG: hypothetical protein SGARI_003743 [Bacillariaceae sp.]